MRKRKAMRTLNTRVRAQTGTEYMLAVSVVVISVFMAFYLLIGQSGSGPMATSFKNVRDVIEAPYP